MTSLRSFLKITRAVCIIQFIFIVLICAMGRATKINMLLILFSGIMGLLVDGFAHVMARIVIESRRRRELDDEFHALLADTDNQSKQ